jgi:hypothetical protein
MLPAAAVVLGHQGAWDEILYFLVPVIAVVAWVRWAERRARARRDAESEPDEEGTEA